MRLKPHRPSPEILSGESADVYFARATRILEREGLDPVVAMEVFSRGRASSAASTRRRTCWPTSCEQAGPGRGPRRGPRRRRPLLAEGGRPADPRPLPRLRPVRDGDPGHDGPGDRLGDRRPRVRRGRRAGAGHQLRRPPRPPGRDRRPGLRRDRRRLRRRLDAGRRPAGEPQPDRDHAPLARAHRRGHRAGRPGLRSRPGARRAPDRPRRHVQGRGRGGAPGRRRARRQALRHPARHAVGARPGHRRPRQGDPGAPGPGRPPPGPDRRLRRPDARPDPLLQGAGGPGRQLRRRQLHLRRQPDRLHRRHQGDRRAAIAKRGRIPGITSSPRLQRVDLAAWRSDV